MVERTYCGTRQPIPQQYSRTGTSYECLRKGVGVGKYLLQPPLQQQSQQSILLWIVFIFLIWFILFIVVILMYKNKHDDEITHDNL